MSSRQPTFESSLAFLLSQIGARSAHLFAETLSQIGVSARAFGVLGNLDTTGRHTQQELADALGVHRNNMVSLIDHLEASGWVRRRRSQIDRRAFYVELTKSGAELVAKVNGLVTPLDHYIGEDLDESERVLLAALLRRVANTLELTPGVHPHLAMRSR